MAKIKKPTEDSILKRQNPFFLDDDDPVDALHPLFRKEIVQMLIFSLEAHIVN